MNLLITGVSSAIGQEICKKIEQEYNIIGWTRSAAKVKNKAIAIKNHAAKYLPITTSETFTGRVNINSIVPDFLSSAHNFIVIAGTKNKYNHG